jgi:putative transposase
VNGRKRHVVVDTMGLLLNVHVHEASISEQWGATRVLAPLLGRFPRLRLVRADAGYEGGLGCWLERVTGLRLEVVHKPPGQKGFAVLPKRWVVERTFAWLGRWRRLSKDHEVLPQSEEALIRLARTALMLRRLHPS